MANYKLHLKNVTLVRKLKTVKFKKKTKYTTGFYAKNLKIIVLACKIVFQLSFKTSKICFDLTILKEITNVRENCNPISLNK